MFIVCSFYNAIIIISTQQNKLLKHWTGIMIDVLQSMTCKI